jgi:hypothetical protein
MHIGSRITLWRPLLIGSVHGLAGSGALLVLVAARIDSVIGRCAYVLMFGVGSSQWSAALDLRGCCRFIKRGSHHRHSADDPRRGRDIERWPWLATPHLLGQPYISRFTIDVGVAFDR